MSSELESDRLGAIMMVMNLESFGVDGAGYDETETEPPSSTNPRQPGHWHSEMGTAALDPQGRSSAYLLGR